MLLPDTYESLPDELSSILNVAEDWLISEIVRKIKKNEEIIASADYQFLMLNEASQFRKDYRKVLAERTKLGLEKIDETFKRAAESSHMFDKRIYETKGIPYVEYKDNPWLQQITEAAANQSKGKFKNLTKTVGFTTNKGEFLEPREFFIRKMSEAELQVGMGITSYSEMIKRTVKELVNSGMKSVEYPNAKPRRVEGAVRANILTGVSDLSGEIGWKHIEELGLTIVETSAHHNARPSHVVWQGKRFALNGTVSEIKAKAEAIREEEQKKRNERSLKKEGISDKIKLNNLEIDSKQFGTKVGKHAREYGMNPSKTEDRLKMIDIMNDIIDNPDEIRQGLWRGQGEQTEKGGHKEGLVDFYVKGNDVVIANNGRFVSLLKDGIDNPRIKNAKRK